MREINKIIIHHTESTGGAVDFMRYLHVELNGWSDVGYHYIITNGKKNGNWKAGGDGEIQGGRPVERMGSHARGANLGTIGVSFVGKLGSKSPTPAQLASAYSLLATLCNQYNLDPRHKNNLLSNDILAHRDVGNTDCPGDNLYALLPSIREKVYEFMVTENLIDISTLVENTSNWTPSATGSSSGGMPAPAQVENEYVNPERVKEAIDNLFNLWKSDAKSHLWFETFYGRRAPISRKHWFEDFYKCQHSEDWFTVTGGFTLATKSAVPDVPGSDSDGELTVAEDTPIAGCFMTEKQVLYVNPAIRCASMDRIPKEANDIPLEGEQAEINAEDTIEEAGSGD